MYNLILLLLNLSLVVNEISASKFSSISSSSFWLNSSFEGTGHISKAPSGPITNSKRPVYTSSELEQINKNRKKCKEVLMPAPDCDLRRSEDFYGRWYVSSIPGLPEGSPICEKVDFYPDTSQHNFFKRLQIYLSNGTWYTQYQNGTLTSPGKLLLDLDLNDDYTPSTPRALLTYTMIDFDPEHYVTAFFCQRGQPIVPVLTRSKKPSMAVWQKIFDGVLKAGASLSWMDLYCRPSVPTNIARYDATPRALPPLGYRNSIEKGEIIF